MEKLLWKLWIIAAIRLLALKDAQDKLKNVVRNVKNVVCSVVPCFPEVISTVSSVMMISSRSSLRMISSRKIMSNNSLVIYK